MSFPLMHNSTFDYKILLLREPQNSDILLSYLSHVKLCILWSLMSVKCSEM